MFTAGTGSGNSRGLPLFPRVKRLPLLSQNEGQQGDEKGYRSVLYAEAEILQDCSGFVLLFSCIFVGTLCLFTGLFIPQFLELLTAYDSSSISLFFTPWPLRLSHKRKCLKSTPVKWNTPSRTRCGISNLYFSRCAAFCNGDPTRRPQVSVCGLMWHPSVIQSWKMTLKYAKMHDCRAQISDKDVHYCYRCC